MPLDLGLARIVRLLKVLGNPDIESHFKAIHVAGTNGKGSICSYVSHILTANEVQNGRFTSPHLLKRSDSIQINDVPIDDESFAKCEQRIVSKDREYAIGCTEFELLTCVAFELFKERKVDVAIFEVGVGGKQDATNVLQSQKLISTGIAKIGLDHQMLLGNTITEIADQKLGILKHGVPCVIDASNCKEVLDLAAKRCGENECELFLASSAPTYKFKFGTLQEFQPPLLGKYQHCNLSVALKIIEQVQRQFPQITKAGIQKGVAETKWPGRLQLFDLQITKDETMPVLLDGAHNPQSVVELEQYLESTYRHWGGNDSGDLCFVMAVKKDKHLQQTFEKLFRKTDMVIFTQFKEGVEGMPWVHPTPAATLEEDAEGTAGTIVAKPELEEALQEAFKVRKATGKNVVICGSLYLVSDVLRLDVANKL